MKTPRRYREAEDQHPKHLSSQSFLRVFASSELCHNALIVMRLLQRQPDGSLIFTKDLDEDKLPPYAILSHTWGSDEEEVSYQDFLGGSGTGKAGYYKLLFCAEQARRDGLEHFWADTCCIDKDNNVELNTAVTSMSRWYTNAKVCYVYLPDVILDDTTNWKSDFPQIPLAHPWLDFARDARSSHRGVPRQKRLQAWR